MTFGALMEMKMYLGEDEGAEVIAKDDENSPGAIVVETLLNIRTVASLSIEGMRVKEYHDALKLDDPTLAKTNLYKGLATGVGKYARLLALSGWAFTAFSNVLPLTIF